jgi:hypothetical protein
VKSLIKSIAMIPLCAGALAAQTIGSLPDKSPYSDFSDGQRFGVVVGYLLTGNDAVGVQQKSAPAFGVRYDLPVGGPAYLWAQVFTSQSTRIILDYTQSAANRNIGSKNTGLIDAEVGLGMSMTGLRTWHKLQPLVNVGVGIVGGMGDAADVSGYQMMPAFTFSTGLGVRYVTGKNSEFRADFGFHFWDLKYPDNYRSTQGDAIAIKPNGGLSSFTASGLLTLGWSLRPFH